ncbi:XRE family transcriptional regulator [Anaerolineae bacterium CFX7]|nr:XRE family transcriptional regulator [Anaerolineae bacterium CFX7]
MDDPLPFGLWIKKRRRALDLTQSALAARVGCSLATIEKIEAEERRPSMQIAELLARALEIPPADRELFLKVARRLKATDGLAVIAPLVAPSPKSSVPIPPTPLIGRQDEMSGIHHLLTNADCRLASLVGPGGIGKTRLGIEFATRQGELFPGGVHYVPLASVNSVQAIVPAIADAFDFTFSGPVDPKEQLFDQLARTIQKPALLVLDNLEHLLAQSSATADLVAEILERLPAVRILCTSRERLNLQGEWTFDLRGLVIPPADAADDIERYGAAALFMQAARRTSVNFKLTDADIPALLRICRMLEGIPLALELAAAWVGVLACDEIAREIESNIDFLTTSMRNVPERHRSLRATFDHSWRLLTDEERHILSRLSIFRGGFDRTAARQVAEATLPLLSSLVAKSLVRRTATGRYDLHEMIRQYALARLEQDAARAYETRARHSEYYLRLAAEHESKLKSAAQQESIRELTVELDNLRAAWAWGIEREKFETVGQAVRAFGWYYEVTGLIYEGIAQMEALTRALQDTSREKANEKIGGACLVQQGLLCFRSGDFAQATALYARAVALLRAANDPALLADALIFSGTINHLSGAYLESKKLIQEGLGYARESNDAWFVAYGVYNIGHVDSIIGAYEKGYAQMQEGLALWRKLGDPHSISLGLNFLVETQIALGRPEEAIAAMHESIALCERTQNRWGMGTAYRYLGLAELARGDCAEAIRQLEASLEIFGEYFKGWDIAQTLIYLGETYLHLGDDVRAKTILRDSLRLARDIHSAPLALQALAGLAALALRAAPTVSPRGAANPAFEWLQLIRSHPQAIHTTRARAEKLLRAAGLSPETLDPALLDALDAIVQTLVAE